MIRRGSRLILSYDYYSVCAADNTVWRSCKRLWLSGEFCNFFGCLLKNHRWGASFGTAVSRMLSTGSNSIPEWLLRTRSLTDQIILFFASFGLWPPVLTIIFRHMLAGRWDSPPSTVFTVTLGFSVGCIPPGEGRSILLWRRGGQLNQFECVEHCIAAFAMASEIVALAAPARIYHHQRRAIGGEFDNRRF
jgi:hypothetical protein